MHETLAVIAAALADTSWLVEIVDSDAVVAEGEQPIYEFRATKDGVEFHRFSRSHTADELVAALGEMD